MRLSSQLELSSKQSQRVDVEEHHQHLQDQLGIQSLCLRHKVLEVVFSGAVCKVVVRSTSRLQEGLVFHLLRPLVPSRKVLAVLHQKYQTTKADSKGMIES